MHCCPKATPASPRAIQTAADRHRAPATCNCPQRPTDGSRSTVRYAVRNAPGRASGCSAQEKKSSPTRCQSSNWQRNTFEPIRLRFPHTEKTAVDSEDTALTGSAFSHTAARTAGSSLPFARPETSCHRRATRMLPAESHFCKSECVSGRQACIGAGDRRSNCQRASTGVRLITAAKRRFVFDWPAHRRTYFCLANHPRDIPCHQSHASAGVLPTEDFVRSVD